MTRKLRWGLLSTAHINQALFEPLRRSSRNTLLAVASRDPEKAQAYARRNKIPRAHASYEALLADPEVEVIYNPLPNSLHAEWTIRALQAGKHVLCEKPLALSTAEVDAIACAARQYQRVVAEAVMYRTHAQTLEVRDLVQAGKLGRVRLLRGSFLYNGTEAGNYRLDPALGGGCLWDVGIYPLGYARFVLGAEPLEVFGWGTTGATGVDETFVAQMRFPTDAYVQFDVSMAAPYHTFIEVIGDEASLVVAHPFTPGVKESLYLTRRGNTSALAIKGTTTYVGEVEDMANAVLNGAPPAVSLADSRGTIAAIQALHASAAAGKPVSLSNDQ